MNNLTTFYIVRHGETEFNVKHVAQGHLDSPLTEKGIKDAANLAFKFKDIDFDLVFSSDLMRAKRTAEIVKHERKLAVATTKLLRERSYGIFEGKHYSAIREYRMLLDKMKHSAAELNLKNKVEEDGVVATRLITFLRETAITYPAKVVLVVTHGGIMRMFLSHLGYVIKTGGIENLGFVKVESDGVDFFVKQMEGIRILNSV